MDWDNKGDVIPQMGEGMMGRGVWTGDNKGDFIPQMGDGGRVEDGLG